MRLLAQVDKKGLCMTVHRYAARRDNAEQLIVDVILFTKECSVARLSGKDITDTIVGRGGVNFLIEIKTGRGKLQAGQLKFRDNWQGQWGMARTPEEALTILGYSPVEINLILRAFAVQKDLDDKAAQEREAKKLAKKVIKK